MGLNITALYATTTKVRVRLSLTPIKHPLLLNRKPNQFIDGWPHVIHVWGMCCWSMSFYCFHYFFLSQLIYNFNPLTPGSNQHLISPFNIHSLSSKQVMSIIKLIREHNIIISAQHYIHCLDWKTLNSITISKKWFQPLIGQIWSEQQVLFTSE